MLLEITLAIIVAKILHFSFEKIKQPGVLGEIIAGIILGPCFVGVLSEKSFSFFNANSYLFQFDLTTPEFKELALIGPIFLMFIVGLETKSENLKKAQKSSFLVSIFGVIVPFFFGCFVGLLFNMTIVQCMALGAIFNATSATIATRIFADMNILSTRVGATLNGAILLNDIFAILIFAIVFGTDESFLLLFIQILLFFAITISLGTVIVRYTAKQNTEQKTPMILLTFALMICLLFSSFAENMGLTAIIGAFIAGLFISKTPQAGVISEHIKTVGYLFFIPLFFVWVGASFDFMYIMQSEQSVMIILFIIVFVSLALLGNFLGGTLGARLSGLKKRESRSIGFGMMPIMGVALIIVTTGVDTGMFGDSQGLLAKQVQMATLFLIITSCLVTPPLLKRSMISPLQKLLGKTKPIMYDRHQCPTNDISLRLNHLKNIGYRDFFDTHRLIKKKASLLTLLQLMKNKEKQKTPYFVSGVFTIILFGLIIGNSNHATEWEKLIAMLGIIFGIMFSYLAIRYYTNSCKLST